MLVCIIQPQEHAVVIRPDCRFCRILCIDLLCCQRSVVNTCDRDLAVKCSSVNRIISNPYRIGGCRDAVLNSRRVHLYAVDIDRQCSGIIGSNDLMPVSYPVLRETACTVLPGVVIVYEELQADSRALGLQCDLIVTLGQEHAVLCL